MENTFTESLCFYLGIDYEYFIGFYKQWLTVRGLSKRINFTIPPTPRLYISIPLKNKSLVYHFDIDTDGLESSLDEMDDQHYESLTPDSLSDAELQTCIPQSPKNKTFSEGCRSTPDIVRTIQKNRTNVAFNRNDSYQTLIELDMDPGFCSDVSCATSGPALKKLDELQKQFSQMQKDIAGLVQMTSNHSNMSFNPIMSSSPYRHLSVSNLPDISPLHTKTLTFAPPPPPPPHGIPPPPPPPPSIADWRRTIRGKSDTHKSFITKGMPDMAEVLKGISSVKLRPVSRVSQQDTNVDSSMPLFARTPLRTVTKQECIIASALRERFRHFRMMNDTDSSSTTNGDWRDDTFEDNNVDRNGADANYGRNLLRRVDPRHLPANVCQDLGMPNN